MARTRDLVELLRERVGKPVNYDNLAQSLSISPLTAKSWVELLEKLFIFSTAPPDTMKLAARNSRT
jgi:predicted AAA+ superfamily ATPase